jgi:hypothetical protein
MQERLRLRSNIGLASQIDAIVKDRVAEQADVAKDLSSLASLASPRLASRLGLACAMQKAAPFGAAFPLSADRGLSSGESPQSEGRVHQACRERRETMRHSTTSFPLLNSEREMGACL